MSGLHLHSLTFPFENQALGSISHLHVSHSAANPKVFLALLYTFFILRPNKINMQIRNLNKIQEKEETMNTFFSVLKTFP